MIHELSRGSLHASCKGIKTLNAAWVQSCSGTSEHVASGRAQARTGSQQSCNLSTMLNQLEHVAHLPRSLDHLEAPPLLDHHRVLHLRLHRSRSTPRALLQCCRRHCPDRTWQHLRRPLLLLQIVPHRRWKPCVSAMVCGFRNQLCGLPHQLHGMTSSRRQTSKRCRYQTVWKLERPSATLQCPGLSGCTCRFSATSQVQVHQSCCQPSNTLTAGV